MDKVTLCDMTVQYYVGVPDEERAKPQRLLVTVELEGDYSKCAASDNIADTIDYFYVSQKLIHFGQGRSWKLIEKLAADLAAMILRDFKPERVSVEVKKFIIPEARYVSFRITRP